MKCNRIHERGTAILAVAMLSLIALTYVSSTLISSLAVKKQCRSYVASQRAYEIAESGVHQLIAKLASPQAATILASGRADGARRSWTNGPARRFTS